MDGCACAVGHCNAKPPARISRAQVQHPTVWTHDEWIHSFDRFLNAINVREVHLYGVSLGAYLAQVCEIESERDVA